MTLAEPEVDLDGLYAASPAPWRWQKKIPKTSQAIRTKENFVNVVAQHPSFD